MEASGSLQNDGYQIEVKVGAHKLMFDEPSDLGGTDTGPSPIDAVVSALVACTSITVQMYAKTKAWPLEEISVNVAGSREEGTGKLVISREIALIGSLDEGQRDRLLGIANRCPVHKILSPQNHIVTKLV